jgi:hypothetical protein
MHGSGYGVVIGMAAFIRVSEYVADPQALEKRGKPARVRSDTIERTLVGAPEAGCLFWTAACCFKGRFHLGAPKVGVLLPRLLPGVPDVGAIPWCPVRDMYDRSQFLKAG